MDTRIRTGPHVPRYIYPFDLRRQPHLDPDVVVIGSGSAGLSAALVAADAGAEVVLLTKSSLSESNTHYAQGGIAAVLNADEREAGDSVAAHVADTEIAGAGMCDSAAVVDLIGSGNAAIDFLRQHGCQFDHSSSSNNDDHKSDKECAPGVALTREGGHNFRRILHANGDATGKEISRCLGQAAEAHPKITILKDCFVLDLLDQDGAIVGVMYMRGGQPATVIAKATILATGGCGRVFRETSNPAIATGDGLAMAYRAGLALCDLEFMQFHPTSLYIAGKPRHLITEAMRGEGAHLLNQRGERFMPAIHPLAELAPRDVVSRAIVKEISQTDFPHVWLDATHLPSEFVRERFPTIFKTCSALGIDITKDWIPVHPSAHYHCGGVVSDTHGRTSMPGLFVAGEVACTGLHGANRLASNSILESLVMGMRAGALAATCERVYQRLHIPSTLPDQTLLEIDSAEFDVADLALSARSLMWRNVGIERNQKGLQTAINSLDFWLTHQAHGVFNESKGWELQNILLLGNLIARAASQRSNSVGTHLRADASTAANTDTNTMEDTVHTCFIKPA